MGKGRNKKHATPVELHEDRVVLENRCRRAGLEPTYDNIKRMKDPRWENLAGRLCIWGLWTEAHYQAAMDFAAAENAFRVAKGLPGAWSSPGIFREVVTGPSGEEQEPDPSLTPEERALRIMRAQQEARRAVKDAGLDAEYWFMGVVSETQNDSAYYRVMHGIVTATPKCLASVRAADALCSHYGLDERTQNMRK